MNGDACCGIVQRAAITFEGTLAKIDKVGACVYIKAGMEMLVIWCNCFFLAWFNHIPFYLLGPRLTMNEDHERKISAVGEFLN
jgi:hypothetical protein